MKLLALDTATEACSVALRVDGATLARYEVLGRGHAERLLPMVDEVLAEAGLALGALDAIAFGRGPGAFTGVRIAVGLAQGLAFGAGLPVVPVSDLAALGRLALDRRLATVDADATAAAVPGAAAASVSARALVCLDARMGEVYWAEVVARADGGVDVPQERLGPPETVVLVGGPGEAGGAGGPGGAGPAFPLVGAGHGWSAYPALAARFPDVTPVWQDLLPRAHEVAALAALEVAAGRVVAPEDAAPVYLRDDVATRSSRQSPFAAR